MKHIHSFEGFLNEGNISMYKNTVQTALKQLGYDLKQSELKVGSKKESNYDLITLNGELLCSSSDYAQMVAWIQNAVKEDPKKYGLDPRVVESTNEAKDMSYWKDYAEGHHQSPKWYSDEVKNASEIAKLVDKVIKNDQAEADIPFDIDAKDEKTLVKMATDYLKQFKTINGKVISAMISQGA